MKKWNCMLSKFSLCYYNCSYGKNHENSTSSTTITITYINIYMHIYCSIKSFRNEKEKTLFRELPYQK